MGNLVYVVTAYRYSSYENHSYLVGVFSTKELALASAESEESFRGGKYECEVIEAILDIEFSESSTKIKGLK